MNQLFSGLSKRTAFGSRIPTILDRSAEPREAVPATGDRLSGNRFLRDDRFLNIRNRAVISARKIEFAASDAGKSGTEIEAAEFADRQGKMRKAVYPQPRVPVFRRRSGARCPRSRHRPDVSPVRSVDHKRSTIDPAHEDRCRSPALCGADQAGRSRDSGWRPGSSYRPRQKDRLPRGERPHAAA